MSPRIWAHPCHVLDRFPRALCCGVAAADGGDAYPLWLPAATQLHWSGDAVGDADEPLERVAPRLPVGTAPQLAALLASRCSADPREFVSAV
jgi:hypothetical protein